MIWSGDVGPELLTQLLISLNKDDKSLTLFSTGGCPHAALAVVDALERFPMEVITTGACMSAAIPILAAGKTRKATPKTMLMLHPPTVDIRDVSVIELDREKEATFKLFWAFCEILGTRTRRKAEWWFDKAIERDPWYFSPKQALEFGLIDEII